MDTVDISPSILARNALPMSSNGLLARTITSARGANRGSSLDGITNIDITPRARDEPVSDGISPPLDCSSVGIGLRLLVQRVLSAWSQRYYRSTPQNKFDGFGSKSADKSRSRNLAFSADSQLPRISCQQELRNSRCLCGFELRTRKVPTRRYTNVLVSSPTCSTQTRTTSPDLRNSFRAMPTPAGVPVRIKSPG
jgi:hypothetical protein